MRGDGVILVRPARRSPLYPYLSNAGVAAVADMIQPIAGCIVYIVASRIQEIIMYTRRALAGGRALVVRVDERPRGRDAGRRRGGGEYCRCGPGEDVGQLVVGLWRGGARGPGLVAHPGGVHDLNLAGEKDDGAISREAGAAYNKLHGEAALESAACAEALPDLLDAAEPDLVAVHGVGRA